MQGTSKGRYTFLMLAGVYLLYLGWKLLSGFISGETTNPVFLISAVLLIGATIVLVIHFKDTLFCESTLIIIIGILFAIFCLGGFYLLLKGK